MKIKIASFGVAVSLIVFAGVAQAALYCYNFTGAISIDALIPDGNLAGYVKILNVSGTGNNDIRDVIGNLI